jgi:hypothetical protein
VKGVLSSTYGLLTTSYFWVDMLIATMDRDLQLQRWDTSQAGSAQSNHDRTTLEIVIRGFSIVVNVTLMYSHKVQHCQCPVSQPCPQPSSPCNICTTDHSYTACTTTAVCTQHTAIVQQTNYHKSTQAADHPVLPTVSQDTDRLPAHKQVKTLACTACTAYKVSTNKSMQQHSALASTCACQWRRPI